MPGTVEVSPGQNGRKLTTFSGAGQNSANVGGHGKSGIYRGTVEVFTRTESASRLDFPHVHVLSPYWTYKIWYLPGTVEVFTRTVTTSISYSPSPSFYTTSELHKTNESDQVE